jgi:hypothetical protein
MSHGPYHIYLRDYAYRRVAELDDFGSLTLIWRFNGAGTWDLAHVPVPNDKVPGLLDVYGGIAVYHEDSDYAIFSGPYRSYRREWDGEKNTISVSGIDETGLLAGRLAHPQPGTDNPPYNVSAYHIVGPDYADAVLWAYINANGPGAGDAARYLPINAYTGLNIGSEISGHLRWQNLLEALAELAQQGGIGFRLAHRSGTLLDFEAYVPVDKSADVVFSAEFGNLSGFEYNQKADEASIIYVAAQGEGTARTVYKYEAPYSPWPIWEFFRDRRDVPDDAPDELVATALEEAAKYNNQHGLTISPLNLPGQRLFVDYNLGDRVSIDVDGQRITDVVREVRLELQAEGEFITPVIESPMLVDDFFAKRKVLEQRVGLLEHR